MITASLATIPKRRASLRVTVANLLPQVDHMNVYMNASPAVPGVDDAVPEFLKHPKITVARSQDTEFGDQGDAGKMYWAEEVEGIHLITDDDMLHPPDYVEQIVAGLDRWDRKAVVGFHGAILLSPFRAYYDRSCRKVFHFGRYLENDVPVHVIAGNSTCYHTDAIEVSRDDFRKPNMADIWMALLGQQQQVPFVCLKKLGGWLKDDEGTREASIYAASYENRGTWMDSADEQTKAVASFSPWRTHPLDGSAPVVVETAEAG